MTRQEYADYQASVADFMKREGLANLSSTDCREYFSWGRCACCGTTEGGSREDCDGYQPATRTIGGPYMVCADCVYYAEYGRLDDLTMAQIWGEA